MDERCAGNILKNLRQAFQKPEYQWPQTLLAGSRISADDPKALRTAAIIKCFKEIELSFKRNLTPLEVAFVKGRALAYLESRQDRLKKTILSLFQREPEKGQDVIEVGDWVVHRQFHLVGQVEKIAPPSSTVSVKEFTVNIEEPVSTAWPAPDAILLCKNKAF